ncbi:unnamed protein product, partial [marine sediment metagenome]
TLAVFGPHKLKELVNDTSNSIADRMDETLFREWVNKLLSNNIDFYWI